MIKSARVRVASGLFWSLAVGGVVSSGSYKSTAYARQLAQAGKADVFPTAWAIPSGWHVDRLVKTAVVEGDVTGTGAKTRAVLMSNDETVRLMVFVDYNLVTMKVYDVFDSRQEYLKSDEGIRIFKRQDFELEAGQPNTCGVKDIECMPDKRVMFHPKSPTLWITLGDWGGDVFHWIGLSDGFQGLSSGD